MKALKTMILCAIMMVCGMNVMADNRDNLIYNSEEVNGLVMSQTVYKNEGGMLINYQKLVYQYDAQNRRIEEVTMKWNNSKNAWVNDVCIRSSYEGKSIINTYYKWNNKQNEFVLVPEMTLTIDNPNL